MKIIIVMSVSKLMSIENSYLLVVTMLAIDSRLASKQGVRTLPVNMATEHKERTTGSCLWQPKDDKVFTDKCVLSIVFFGNCGINASILYITLEKLTPQIKRCCVVHFFQGNVHRKSAFIPYCISNFERQGA